jgi:hypothetical protein
VVLVSPSGQVLVKNGTSLFLPPSKVVRFGLLADVPALGPGRSFQAHPSSWKIGSPAGFADLANQSQIAARVRWAWAIPMDGPIRALRGHPAFSDSVAADPAVLNKRTGIILVLGPSWSTVLDMVSSGGSVGGLR